MCITDRNHILTLLPERSRRTLARDLHVRPLRRGELLAQQDTAVNSIYFPLAGAISLIAHCEGDSQIEVASADSAGVVGSLLLLGDELSPWDAVVELDGEALVMSADAARECARQDRLFDEIMARYSLLLVRWLSQAATCQTYHTVSKRLARWLLAMQDAAETQEFAITQDCLARMLGVQRPSVTISAGALQRTGAVEFRRGRVRIRSRRILMRESCQCYETLMLQRRRLLGSFDRSNER